MSETTFKNEAEVIGDVIAASKHAGTSSAYHVSPSQYTNSSRGNNSNASPFLININRTTPIRVGDLSTITSIPDLIRYVSPLALTFHERATRHKFVRNLFAVLTLQFCFITALVSAAKFVKPFNDWLRAHWYFLCITSTGMFVLIFAMACVRTLRITYPVNMVMLTLFTMGLAATLAFASVYDNMLITLMVLGLITLVCFCVTLNAIQVQNNITTWGMFMYIAVQTVLIFGVGAAILLKFTTIEMKAMVYSVLTALTFCLYLAYDTQEILAGKRKEVTPENVILGVIKLYVDCLYIFCLFCFLCEQRNY